MSNHLVKAVPNPNLNVVEDRVKNLDPSLKDITLTVARISSLTQFLNELD